MGEVVNSMVAEICVALRCHGVEADRGPSWRYRLAYYISRSDTVSGSSGVWLISYWPRINLGVPK